MSKKVTAIAELPEELLLDWKEWVESHGGRILTPRSILVEEKNNESK